MEQPKLTEQMVEVHYFDRDVERLSSSLDGGRKKSTVNRTVGRGREKTTDFFTILVEKSTQLVRKSAYREAAQHLNRPVKEVIEELIKEGYTHTKLS
jgi:hypothetical protein